MRLRSSAAPASNEPQGEWAVAVAMTFGVATALVLLALLA
jgi:hypothetical protein